MKNINILFPNQLFKANPLLEIEGDFLLVEEVLFFQHFEFHVQKLDNRAKWIMIIWTYTKTYKSKIRMIFCHYIT